MYWTDKEVDAVDKSLQALGFEVIVTSVRKEVLRYLEPLIIERECRGKAQVLRDAAERVAGPSEDLRHSTTCWVIASELRDHADRIEAGNE